MLALMIKYPSIPAFVGLVVDQFPSLVRRSTTVHDIAWDAVVAKRVHRTIKQVQGGTK